MIKLTKSIVRATVGIFLLANAAYAQVGSDNPTGISGQYNGNVTTGCSYDPYTANTTRSITDIVVAGGVGAYPLAFTRTMNSRYNAGVPTPFGPAGSWNHSFGWNIDSVTVVKTGSVGRPASYSVNYPDGRRVIFSNTGTTDPDFRGPLGIRDRFEQLASGGTECYLRLPDGGRIWFHATITTTHTGSGGSAVYTSIYVYALFGIVDPYGQTTTITSAAGSLTATESAGRMLKIFYKTGPAGDTVVDRVEEWMSSTVKGRTVTYIYSSYAASGTNYSSLTSVTYPESLTATYTYQNSNLAANGRPLIKTCTDPMFDGPMWMIAYDFAPNASGVVYGQLLREKHPNGTAVSTLTVTGTSTRTETRGDNPTGTGNPVRTFTYNTYRLKNTSDFKGVNTLTQYDNNFYVSSITDRNGNATTYNCDALTGNINLLTQPLSGDVVPANTPTRIAYKYGASGYFNDPNNQDGNNPYYLATIEDGNGNPSQQFFLDSSHRTIESDHIFQVTGSSVLETIEKFTYTNFGQVQTHQLRNTKNESYEYDSAGKVMAYRDAKHPTPSNPTARYQYDSLGRVSGITDALGGSSGDTSHTTTFLYNLRGQLTQLTHPDGTFIQYHYNPNGTLWWTADERHQSTTGSDLRYATVYTYDDYKRLRTITTPLRSAPGQPVDSTSRLTSYFYDANGTGDDYTRTVAGATKILSAGGKTTTSSYDANLRTLTMTVKGDVNVPDATTSYTYDNVGNVLTVKDPNGQGTGAVTNYHYDNQNRLSSIDDAISVDRNSSGHTMSYAFDPGGNRIQETRADNLICHYAYDAFGRLKTKTGYAGEVMGYTYDDDDNLTGISVPGGNTYSFQYDELDRKTGETYPVDYSGIQRTETYAYVDANNVDTNHIQTYTNPAGQTKTLIYDNRGRLTDTSWTNDPAKGGTGPAVHITYDAARPTGITTSAYTVAGIALPGTSLGFGYDEANNRTYEDQTITGLPTHRVQTTPDADGSRLSLIVSTNGSTDFANNFEYTNRNELRNINNGPTGNGQPLFTYSYDASGNVLKRQARALQGDATTLAYDALNRPTDCTHSISGTNFSVSHYGYTPTGNLDHLARDSTLPYEDGRGDYFKVYDGINQLTSAFYSATGPSDPSPAKSVSYTVGNKSRDAMTVVDNTAHTTIATNYAHNALSQYTQITVNGGTPQQLQYDNNFDLTSYNGWTYSYDAENHLCLATANGHSAQLLYDATGRCIRRTIDGTTTVLGYDQWTPIVEWDGSGNLVATNVYGLGDDEILSRSSGSTQLFYKSDPVGNVRFLLNGSGTVVEKYTYDAFGQATVTQFNGSQPTGNRFMFSGREYFSSLGLYDLRNRIYDPVMGRFYQTDPIGFAGDPTNLYRFCGNNPLLGGDPTGLLTEDFEMVDGGMAYGVSGVSSSNLFNDPIEYSSISWSSYSETLSSNQANQAWASFTGHIIRGAFQPLRNVFGVVFARDTEEFIAAQDGFWGIFTPPVPVPGQTGGEYADGIVQSLKTPEGQAALVSGVALAVVSGRATFVAKEMPVVPKLVARDVPVLRISSARYPDLADNILNAQKAGHSDILTHGGPAKVNRAAALQGVPTVSGLTRDEYPFASSIEGGGGSWVGHIPGSQNSAGGGLLQSVIRRYSINPGDRYRVVVESFVQ